MLCQLLVRAIQFNLVFPVLDNTGFEVVALNHFGYAAEILEGVDMGACPALLIHREELGEFFSAPEFDTLE